MILRVLNSIFDHTLRSVLFGIALLVLIGAYIAVGSAFPGVREYFEKDELAFFNSWPLKWLMALLVMTLICVTLERIPFKPTRWGAWIVHIGIITLIAGTAWHYALKVEGSVPIFLGRSTQHYYDRWERALYVRLNGATGRAALPSLPRFHSFAETLGNADQLNKPDLADVQPLVQHIDPTMGQAQWATVAEAIGVPSLRMKVVGYWPYARVQQKLTSKPGSDATGFWFQLPEEDFGDDADVILIGKRPRYARAAASNIEFEHRPLPNEAALKSIVESSSKFHTLKVALPGFEQTLQVDVGKSYPLGSTGYTLRVEAFDPHWQTMDKQIVPLLTIMVESPTQKYRRLVISGREGVTDFKLDVPGAGPMGKRQTESLDPSLVTTYTFDDPAQLMPRQRVAQYTFFTTPDSNVTTVIGADTLAPATVQTVTGSGPITITEAVPSDVVMMESFTGQKQPRRTWSTQINRQEKADVDVVVEEIPKDQRTRDEGEAGVHQVLMVRASTDDGWKQDVLVPFSDAAIEMQWHGGLLEVPGATGVVQLALGRNWKTLPARLKLEKFEAEAYGGAQARAGNMMRDFRSTLSITNPNTGKSVTETAFLNSPIFYDGGKWIFFQSGWDAQGQQYSVIGVGNRPGVPAMITGCILIFVGIIYAFYFKPILISLMQKRAVARARAQRPPAVPVARQPELVTQSSHT